MKAAFFAFIVFTANCLAWASAAQAQAYPSRPIHMIVAYAPGGAVDVVARKTAASLGKYLNQTVIIENRPGASGNIGGDYVSKSRPDGYTLLFAPSTLIANPLVMKNKPPFDVQKDLAPISLVASGPLLLLVPMSGPTSVREFVANAKGRPDRVNFGTGGFGSAGHLSAEYFKLKSGIDNTPMILYRGTGPAMNDLISGQLSAMMDTSLSAMPQVRAGRVRALAITADKRDPLFPDVPTFAEAGFSDMQFSTWYGVWGPAGLPKAVTSKLAQAFKIVLSSPENQAWLAQQGYEASPISGASLNSFLHKETTRYEHIVRDGHIEPR